MILEPTFSGDDLLATVGPHVDMLEELRDTFAEEYPQVLAAIRGAAAAQDARLLADKAHLMKNVAAMAGGPSSRQLSIAIEDAAKAGDYGRATALIDRLAQELAGLQQALTAFVAAYPSAGGR
ncbi:MAG TPA: Hpt domain-containing protein [Vicinamibacterales bacterium]|nr:Hpt domain-containing protein [Vicinamibacterales bacterium]